MERERKITRTRKNWIVSAIVADVKEHTISEREFEVFENPEKIGEQSTLLTINQDALGDSEVAVKVNNVRAVVKRYEMNEAQFLSLANAIEMDSNESEVSGNA